MTTARSVESAEKDDSSEGDVVAQPRGGAEPPESEIMQLPDEEVVARLDELVESWRQQEDAVRQLRRFEGTTGAPAVKREHYFHNTDAFLEFNRRRREYVRQYEELTRQREDADERYNQVAAIISVLLPEDSGLIYRYGRFDYVIRNTQGQLTVQPRR